MIDIKEIRAGNCLDFNLNTKGSINTHYIVKSIDICNYWNGIGGYLLIRFDYKDDGDSCFGYDNYYPIVITEDLLLQLGFQKEVDEIYKEGFYMYLPNGFRIDINKYSNTIGRDYGILIENLCCDSVLSGDIQYLHQLQNYIYDSTKQELDITNII